MRPERFESFAVEQLAAHQAVTGARALRDLGESRYPYGVAARFHDGAEYRWQITAESAPGEKYGEPETPADGAPAPAVPAPQPAARSGPYGLADADEFLAHILTTARCREFRAIRRREGGLTIRCHSGATLYLRALPVPAKR